ncbi:Uncharacterised protein [Actinomyces howellii]|uniref:Uncharacterized protein n=1 Tax=Actinomyces howellii TaxID=52771 RepID=A0A448HGW5_9ACTO|nr:Uncharacterised protein [Actinomyces howellii]
MAPRVRGKWYIGLVFSPSPRRGVRPVSSSTGHVTVDRLCDSESPVESYMTGRELHDRSRVVGVCGDGVCALSAVVFGTGPGRDRAGRRWPDRSRTGAGLAGLGRSGGMPGPGWSVSAGPGARPRPPWVGVLVGAARWCTHQLPSRPRPTPVIERNNDRLVAGGAGVCVRRGGRCTSQASTAVPAMGAGRGDPRDSAVSPRRPPAITCLFCASHPGGGVGRPLRRPPADRHAGAPARQPVLATPSTGPTARTAPALSGRGRVVHRRCGRPPCSTPSGAPGTLRQNCARCGDLEVP